MSWNPTTEQQAIIAHDTTRHGRILAGPGTGKSATVIRMMLEASRDSGGRGKLLTFTRAATNELKEKAAEHGDVLEKPSTIHSFAIATLLDNPGTSCLPEPIRIADDWEWKHLIREHLKELVGCGVKVIDRARDEMASNWQSLDTTADPDLPVSIRNRFSGAWEQHRSILGYSLLAELPFRLLRALQDHPNLKLGVWRILIVDEYQDLNRCDLDVLNQISLRGYCLLAAGDDDQSIYSFRRALPAGIRRFPSDYLGAADYTLSISHRCGTSILAWARHVIEGLPGRPSRPPLSPAEHCNPGVAKYLRFENWPAEVDGVARIVRWLVERRGVTPEDIAILFRSNHNNVWSTTITKALQRFSIPVVNPRAVEEMLTEPSNRRLLAIARLVVNRSDALAWWTILDLTTGIGPKIRNHFYESARDAGVTFGDRLLSEYTEGFPQLSRGGPLVTKAVGPVIDLINSVDIKGADRGESGWGTWLAQQAPSLGGCEDAFGELLVDLDEIVDSAAGLGGFLSQIQPVGKDLRSGRAAGAVRVMSMASSKGLTVKAALVVGVEQGVIPLARANSDEERRLLYVAMTRSTDYLYLTWAGRRTGPTARTGAPNVGRGRNRSPLLTQGPINSESGPDYLRTIDA